MIFCERCGDTIEADGASVAYCIRCGLFVCTGCWDQSGACTTCRPTGRRTLAIDVTLMRRADRRLREVWREAVTLAPRVADEGESDEQLGTELACLRRKASAAIAARDEIVARRRTPKRKAMPAALPRRVDRHATESERLLLRLESALARRVPSASDRSPEVPATRARGRWFRRRTWIPVLGTAAALTLAAAALVVIASDRIRDDQLAGGPAVSPVSEPTPVQGGEQGTTPTVAASPLTIARTFDDERIGFPEGWERVVVGGTVSVVALPSSFNRSLEVTTTDGELVSSCLQLDPTMPLGAFEVDVLVGASDEAVARVTLGTAVSGQLVEVEVGVRATSIHASDGSSIIAAGVAPEEWHRLRLLAQEDGYEVVLDVAGDTGERAYHPLLFATESLGSLSRVCLEVLGPSGSTARYDNLTLHTISPVEG